MSGPLGMHPVHRKGWDVLGRLMSWMMGLGQTSLKPGNLDPWDETQVHRVLSQLKVRFTGMK